MANILITSEYFCKFSSEARKMLIDAGHKVIDNPYGHSFLNPEQIIRHSGSANAFICDLEQINRSVIDASPELRIISRRGVGVDSVDVDYAKSKGITVARTTGVVEAPVAELVMGYILEFSRNISKLSSDMHHGIWEKTECHSIDKKTLGFIGMGKIAFEVARRARAFGMNIVYCDLVGNARCEQEFGAKKTSFDEVLRVSDFVTIHTPLTDETKGLFSYKTICKMKGDAVLINTARGAIIEEESLYRAIFENRIRGAALDVFTVEPKTDSILNTLPNVLLTPHTGTFTREIFIEMDILAAQNIINYFTDPEGGRS